MSYPREILVAMSDAPWPINTGGKIDFHFTLRALRKICSKVFLIFSYSHRADVDAFAEKAPEICDEWYAFPRKKNLLRMLHPSVPYALLSNKPNEVETAEIINFLKEHTNGPDAILMSHLNSYFIAKILTAEFPKAKRIYRMHNIESVFLSSLFSSFSFFSLRKWVSGIDYLRMKRAEPKLIRECQHIACISKDEMQTVSRYIRHDASLIWIPPFFDFQRNIRLNREQEVTFSSLRERFSDRPVLFFASNFYGGFNVSTTNWFLKVVLPRIQRLVSVDFILAGFRARDYFSDDPAVRVHVFSDFDSVKPFMLLANVVLILTSGKAGIKLKLMEAVAYRKNVVSTVEGVYGSGLEGLVPNTNDPDAFARCVVNQLKEGASQNSEIDAYFSAHFNPSRNAERMLTGGAPVCL